MPEITQGELVSANAGYKCLSCITEYINANNEWIDAGQPDGEEPSKEEMLSDAITLAPSWQQNAMMGQVMVVCVAVPSCLRHLGVREKTPLEKAAESGLMIPSQSLS